MQKKIETNTDHLLKVSLHGMDKKMMKMMSSYFKLTCKGIAVVVEENEAQAEIVDVDSLQFDNILRQRLSQRPKKPIIALSLYTVSSNKVTFVKKPLDVAKMSSALLSVKEALISNTLAEPEKLITQLGYLKETLKTSNIINESTVAQSDTDKAIKSPLIIFSVPKIEKEKAVLSNESLLDEKNKQLNPPFELNEARIVQTKKNTEKTDYKEIDSVSLNKEIRLQYDRKTSQLLPNQNKKKSNKKNLRKTIRYTFQAFSCKLKSHSFLRGKNNLTVKILNISSNSALIQSRKPLKLRDKATIDIKFDILNSFSIPVRVSRKNNKNNTYGLVFLKYQHELCDYLVNSGRPFNID